MENRIVTIKDLAKKAGVSVSTVSRAFNNYSDISKTTREHILKVAEEIGYKPNISVKNSGSSQYFRLGMFVEGYESSVMLDPIVFEILMPFRDTISKQGYELVLLSTNTDIQKHQSLTKFFKEKQLDGAFILGLKTTDEYFKELSSIDYPCVLFDINIQNPKLSCIGVDNTKGAFMAVEHLIKLGHRKIAFINGHEQAVVSYERMDGYYLALNRYGIPVDNSLIVDGNFTDKGAEMAIEKLINQYKDITAVFCASDLMAAGAINMLNNLGYTVPEDISVVGFDDIYIAQYMSPKLTTIRQNRDRIGRSAANVLINLVNGQSIGRILIEPELIVRESTKRL
jgi:LacI family transcriptional regulator